MNLNELRDMPLTAAMAVLGITVTPVQAKILNDWLRHNGTKAQLSAIKNNMQETEEHFMKLRSHICLN